MSESDELNGQHVLYRHWGKNGKLLYAGRTNNPSARLGQHRAKAPWWTLVAWTTYESFPSLEALKDREAEAIRYEHPEWNIQGKQYPANDSRQSPEPGLDRYTPIKTSDLVPGIRLVHPLSREFSVYGGEDTIRRAREWALQNRYYLLDGVPACAHAFYRMRCPNIVSKCLPHADHTEIWIPAPDFSDFERRSGAEAPFILTQPYRSSLPGSPEPETDWFPGEARGVPAGITAYADAHGLDVEVWINDAWYYPEHCLPIRLTPRGQEYTAFPLTTETLSLMCAWRDEWPETVPEWLRWSR